MKIDYSYNEFGFATICPGLSIGDTYATSLRKILEKYNYQNHEVIAALYDNGIEGLMNLASSNGFVPEEAYVNGCHFCYEARKFLRGFFPDAFVLLARQKSKDSRACSNRDLSRVSNLVPTHSLDRELEHRHVSGSIVPSLGSNIDLKYRRDGTISCSYSEFPLK